MNALIESKLGMAGYYKMVAVNAETGAERVLADWFPNLITDIGLDRIATGSIFTNCQVGSGTNTPAVTDTSLQTFVANTATITAQPQANSGSPDYYAKTTTTYRFGQGVAAGNLSEVGVGWSSGAGTLFSRARILDGSGNPTTITVLANEFLDVVYELRMYPTLTDSSFNFTMSSVTYACVMRWANVNSGFGVPTSGITAPGPGNSPAYNGAIGAITASPSGTSSADSNSSTAAYNTGTYQRDFTITWGLNNGNLSGGITAIRFGSASAPNLFSRQCSFSPAINKDNTKTLNITYRVSWARKTLP